MKRTIRLLALILTLTLALSAAAMATEIDYGKGETNATKSVSAVSLVDGCTVAFEGEKLKVTYTNANFKDGDMVIVFLLETKDKDGKITEVKTEEAAQTLIVPTAENIKYIDQKSVAKATATNGSVSFDIYPQDHTSALVRIISVNAATNKVTDENIAAVKLNYTLGDVNRDKSIDSLDALRILQYAANRNNTNYALESVQAADVNLDKSVDSLDALRVLQYAANRNNPNYALGK